MSSKRSAAIFLGGFATALSLVCIVSRFVRKSEHKRQLLTNLEHNPDAAKDDPDAPLRRLRKAEGVIQHRTTRITIVVERATKSHNYSAVMRTAEALGIQNLWVIAPPRLEKDAEDRKKNYRPNRQYEEDAKELQEHVSYAKKAAKWLTIRGFQTTEECIAALRADKREIWVTDLSQAAVPLTSASIKLPDRLAIVIGTESTGATAEMLKAADKRVYIPLNGWADSLNLSVAAALVLQRLLFIDPDVVGDISEEEKAALRLDWYDQMARNPAEKEQYLKLAQEGGVAPFDDLRRPDAHRLAWLTPRLRKRLEKSGIKSGIGTITETKVDAS